MLWSNVFHAPLLLARWGAVPGACESQPLSHDYWSWHSLAFRATACEPFVPQLLKSTYLREAARHTPEPLSATTEASTLRTMFHNKRSHCNQEKSLQTRETHKPQLKNRAHSPQLKSTSNKDSAQPKNKHINKAMHLCKKKFFFKRKVDVYISETVRPLLHRLSGSHWVQLTLERMTARI